MAKQFSFSFILILSLFFLACTKTEVSPEDGIKQYIESGKKAAENRSASDLADLISESYRDHRRLDKNQIVKLLRVYFFRHKNIYLFTKIKEITLHSKNEASVTLYVAMAGTVISDVSLLSSLRAKVYKFELELVKQESWLLQQATWQVANMQEMQLK